MATSGRHGWREAPWMVAVGYMDLGNWATDLAGGAKFGFTLLSVILVSNLMAILLQHLCIKLGVATGRDLAQACRDSYSTPIVWGLEVLCEVAITACDLAEVVGSAIGLQLLIASQAVLSMQLGFAVWPLMRFTGDRVKMGEFVNPTWIKVLGWTTAAVIIVLNVKLLLDTFLPEAFMKSLYGALGLPAAA